MTFDIKAVAALIVATAAVVWGWFEIFATQEQVEQADQAIADTFAQQLAPIQKSAERSARRADAETLQDLVDACEQNPTPAIRARVEELKAEFSELYGSDYIGGCD